MGPGPSPKPCLPDSVHWRSDWRVLVGLLLVAYILTARSLPAQVSPFNLTHWLFSYQDGLYSRALVGSLTRVLLGGYRGLATVVAAVSGAMTAVLMVTVVLIGFRYWRRERSDTALLTTVILVACPGTIQYFAAESGRLDQVGYLVVIAACFALLRIRGGMQWVVVSATSVVLCLIHEAFIIMLAPTLVAAVLAIQSSDGNNRQSVSQYMLRAVLSLLPAMGLAATLVTVGRLDYDSQLVEVVRRLSEAADFNVSPTAILVHFRSLGQNALYTREFWFDLSRVPAFVTTLVALLPSGVVAFGVALRSVQLRSAHPAGSQSQVLEHAVIICCLAPLALVIQGVDYSRWIAAAVTNMFLVGMVVRSCAGTDATDCQTTKARSLPGPFLFWVVLFSLAVGPVSPTEGPYSLQRLVEALRAVLGMTP